MPKPKTLLKQLTNNKNKKHKGKDTPALETADDFLAVGVEHEESAGKWRAGDAVKAMRFFGRAIDVYDQGLVRFPGNFDLAYNKARVQLEVATHPLLVSKLDVSVQVALERALESHRVALQVDGGGRNADLLFNSAQVLTALAEVDQEADGDRTRVLGLLEEALTLLTKCWDVQERKFEEDNMQRSMMEVEGPEEEEGMQETTEGGDQNVRIGSKDSGNDSTPLAQEDQWFSVVEPVTRDTLIDTLLAQIGTLTTLCDVLASAGPSPSPTTGPGLVWIEEVSHTIVNKRLPPVAQDAEPARQAEIRVAIARLSSSLLEAGFRHGSFDAATFKRERDKAFDLPEVTSTEGSQPSYEALVANAESLAALESAVAELLPAHSELAAMRWQALASAMACLATAAKLAGNTQDEMAKTHFLRGDASLNQFQMAAPPLAYPPAVSNQKQLLKNAEVFYRNASKLYQDEERRAQAALRFSIVQVVDVHVEDAHDAAKRMTTLTAGHPKGQDWFREQVQIMADEGLLPNSFPL